MKNEFFRQTLKHVNNESRNMYCLLLLQRLQRYKLSRWVTATALRSSRHILRPRHTPDSLAQLKTNQPHPANYQLLQKSTELFA